MVVVGADTDVVRKQRQLPACTEAPITLYLKVRGGNHGTTKGTGFRSLGNSLKPQKSCALAARRLAARPAPKQYHFRTPPLRVARPPCRRSWENQRLGVHNAGRTSVLLHDGETDILSW